MSRRLLLADDSVTIQKVIEITLSDKDYILRVAGDGDTALQMARDEVPDLILADVFMPGKNGYEVCEAVRNDSTLKDTPVLLLAGTFEPFDQDKARAVGANDWIGKPFSSQMLIDKVEELLALAPDEDKWQPQPSSAPGDQDILQALDEVTARQGLPEQAAAPQPSVEPEVQPVAPMVELEPFEFASNDTVIEPAASSDLSTVEAADAFADDGLAPFAGFDVPEATSFEPESIETEDTFAGFALPEENVPAESVPEENLLEEAVPTAPVDFDFAVSESTASEVSDLGLGVMQVDQQQTPAPELPTVETVAPDQLESMTGDLPSLVDFQATASNAPVSAAIAVDGIIQLKEDDIVAEGAYGAVPERVAQRVAFLSDEQLTEIVERVAGAVIERLATPLVEQVVWEVVPDLAESMVREEMAKLKAAAV